MADICRNRHGGADTSIDAYASTPAGRRRQMASRIWQAIADAPDGLTCDQVEFMTGWSHQTVSARISELARGSNMIRDTGRRRPTRTGRPARVYCAVPVQQELW